MRKYYRKSSGIKEIVSRETGSVSGLPEVFWGVPGITGKGYIGRKCFWGPNINNRGLR